MEDYFSEVIGYEEIKNELRMVLDMLENQDKYQKLGANIPKSILLEGEPGVGKTLMASCFVKATRRMAYTIRKKATDGDFLKEIVDVFHKACENAPSIIFLDDMDKFANALRDSGNYDEYVTIQSCLDECRNEDVIMIATINDSDLLPGSLLRPGRIDKIITVKKPTGNDAIKVIKHYMSTKKIADDVDYNEIYRLLDGNSCARLENVINEAAIIAGYKGKESIEHEDLIAAFMRVEYDAPAKEDSIGNSECQLNVPIHEAGHAVVSEVLEPGSVNLITVKKHASDIDGFVSYRNDEHYFESKKFMENRVVSLLAGRAATEVVYGTVDVGSNSDLHRAFAIVKRFVDGYNSYGFTTWEGIGDRGSSASVLDHKEFLVQMEMERYYQIAKKIILDNKDFLIELANRVQKEKYLTFNQIQEIKSRYKMVVPGIFAI